jgi:CheY-like chemotaxis protein
MRILLVEDDENKRSALEAFITSEVPSAEIEEAKSLQAGVRRARTSRYDLVILDMTLPNYDPSPDEPGGGTIHSFGGREFLKQMDRFRVTTPVIVVTQFEKFGKPPTTTNLEELDQSLRDDFSATYRGSVYYHAAIVGWQQELASLIEATIQHPGNAA